MGDAEGIMIEEKTGMRLGASDRAAKRAAGIRAKTIKIFTKPKPARDPKQIQTGIDRIDRMKTKIITPNGFYYPVHPVYAC